MQCSSQQYVDFSEILPKYFPPQRAEIRIRNFILRYCRNIGWGSFLSYRRRQVFILNGRHPYSQSARFITFNVTQNNVCPITKQRFITVRLHNIQISSTTTKRCDIQIKQIIHIRKKLPSGPTLPDLSTSVTVGFVIDHLGSLWSNRGEQGKQDKGSSVWYIGQVAYQACNNAVYTSIPCRVYYIDIRPGSTKLNTDPFQTEHFLRLSQTLMLLIITYKFKP